MSKIGYIHIALELWGSIFCYVCAFILFITRHYERKYSGRLLIMLLSIGTILLSDAAAWYFRGGSGDIAYAAVRISNFVCLLFNLILLISAAMCYEGLIAVRSNGKADSKLFIRSEMIICSFGIVMLILSRFFGFYYRIDENNLYHRDRFMWLYFLICTLGALLILIFNIKNFKYLKNLEKNAMIFHASFLFPAIIVQLFFYGAAYINFANAAGAIMIFISYEMQRTRDLDMKEKEAEEQRAILYNRQIRPHFIVNSLLTISDLCEGNEEAQEALDHFTRYLRSSANFYTETNLVPLRRELELVENYLYMERMRFGDKIGYEIIKESEDFRLPPFTIQTLVENSVRHGIRKNEDGSGKITIKITDKDDSHVIEIRDNGPGFDPAHPIDDNDAHIGVENVNTRLKLMCGGELIMRSVRGEGTTATIVIPDPESHKIGGK